MVESSGFQTEAIMCDGVPATRVTYQGDAYSPTAIYVDGCGYCDGEKERDSWFFPNHFASSRCQSGKRNHCTCDTCF